MPRKTYRLDYISERILSETKYMLLTQGTLTKTSKYSNRCPSSIHKDLTVILPKINAELAREVRILLNKNIKERSARGGEANKQKILLRQNKNQNV